MEFKRNLRKVIRFLRYMQELLLEQAPEKVRTILRVLGRILLTIAEVLIPILVTLSFTIIIYNVGFEDFYKQHHTAYFAHGVILLILEILFTIRFLIVLLRATRWRSRFFNFFLVILVFYLKSISEEITTLDPGHVGTFTEKKLILFFGIVILFVTEVSHILRFIYKRGANPALLFVGSFATFIIIGGFMLLLPNATTNNIDPVDAFFTSASAVCVTGLIVVDTATAFTLTGQVIILILIQMGGLGIMTFAGMISFLVTGSVSFQNQLALRDMLSSNRMSNVISFISRVVIVTITFEAIGAFMIYGSLSDGMFNSESEKVFFSVFHAISAFCNAGFSTLSDGLYDGTVRFDYGLHWVIAILIMLGGMGFPVVFNIFTFLRIKVTNIVKRLVHDPQRESYTNILQATAKLSLATYFILLIIGFAAYFVFEFNFTLHEHNTLFGKITTSFFGSITPRTAGFNTVDITLLSLPMLMIYLLLMYIGASPGSTGGGIKTTVAAVAFLNMKSIVSGQDRTEAFRSEVSMPSIKRAFAIILLSLLVLGIAVLLLSIYDSEQGLLKLAFEAFSAFSTVGLTLGVTPQLSVFGKLVVMGVMFIGRVGALTLLFAVVTKSTGKLYRYPSEDIMF
jgi:trk system potassium uptake protein TrkH